MQNQESDQTVAEKISSRKFKCHIICCQPFQPVVGVSTGEQKPAAEDTEKRHQCSSLPPGKDTGRRLQKTKIGRPKMSTGMGL